MEPVVFNGDGTRFVKAPVATLLYPKDSLSVKVYGALPVWPTTHFETTQKFREVLSV